MICPFNIQFSFPWYRINWIKNVSLNEAMYENMMYNKNTFLMEEFAYDDNYKVKFSYIDELWNI